MIPLNVQPEEKAVAWSRSKSRNTMKAASGHTSPPSSRNPGRAKKSVKKVRSNTVRSIRIQSRETNEIDGSPTMPAYGTVSRGITLKVHWLLPSLAGCWWALVRAQGVPTSLHWTGLECDQHIDGCHSPLKLLFG